jgi:hypothetical protein
MCFKTHVSKNLIAKMSVKLGVLQMAYSET